MICRAGPHPAPEGSAGSPDIRTLGGNPLAEIIVKFVAGSYNGDLHAKRAPSPANATPGSLPVHRRRCLRLAGDTGPGDGHAGQAWDHEGYADRSCPDCCMSSLSCIRASGFMTP